MLVLVEVALDKLFKVAQAHLPRLALLDLHLVEAAHAQPVAYVLLESVVQEGTPAQAAGADGRLFDSEWLEGDDLVSDETACMYPCQLSSVPRRGRLAFFSSSRGSEKHLYKVR